MKESKAMMKKEVSFMKKKGAPKSMLKHEMKEAGMKYGGKVKKMAAGGLAAGHKSADGVAKKGKTKGKDRPAPAHSMALGGWQQLICQCSLTCMMPHVMMRQARASNPTRLDHAMHALCAPYPCK